uniref:Uncharacterized protein n=1 Tax=Gadus morhua TaxID=8049 RepID=A0A8C5BL58_GADMO
MSLSSALMHTAKYQPYSTKTKGCTRTVASSTRWTCGTEPRILAKKSMLPASKKAVHCYLSGRRISATTFGTAARQQIQWRISGTCGQDCYTISPENTSGDLAAVTVMLTDASQQETVASVDTVESVDTGDQPLPSSTSDAGTQCYLKPPRWSHAVQVNLKPKMVSVGTQTSISPQTSTPLASPEQTVDDDDDDNATVISDLSWVPEEPMDEEELFDEEPPYTCDPHHNCIDKFIVCQEELMGLFAICPACCERSDSSIVQQEGTFVKIKQVWASCGYHRFWQNQPMLHRNMPTCNLLLSGAIHFTGCLATQTLSSFFRHQRRYTIPVIVQAWQNDQAKNFSDLRAMDGGLVLAGDCRSDSPGHCAKYGSYSLMEDRVNKVVDVQLVQVNLMLLDKEMNSAI